MNMKNSNNTISHSSELGQAGEIGLILSLWQKTWFRVLVQILFLLGMSGVAAWAKSVSPGIGIPGSSGILWVTPLVIGRMAVQKRGAGILMGVTTALWGVPFGIHNALFYNLFLYGITGVALDLAAVLPFINIRNPFGAVFCGVFAHLIKFGFISEAAMLTGVSKNFIIFGLAKAGILHIAFGAAAGILAWLAYKGIKTWVNKDNPG
jgi:hypothetical protein